MAKYTPFLLALIKRERERERERRHNLKPIWKGHQQFEKFTCMQTGDLQQQWTQLVIADKWETWTFWSDIPVVFYRIIKYKQNVVKHNSVDDFIKVYSYVVSFNDLFRL
jgi:hypothetical protein